MADDDEIAEDGDRSRERDRERGSKKRQKERGAYTDDSNPRENRFGHWKKIEWGKVYYDDGNEGFEVC